MKGEYVELTMEGLVLPIPANSNLATSSFPTALIGNLSSSVMPGIRTQASIFALFQRNPRSQPAGMTTMIF